MLAKVQSCAIVGLDAEQIDVEVDITSGLERLTVVGLPNAAVRESGERVRSAIANSGFFFPQHRLTVNLAPADLRKEGPAYDLPIAPRHHGRHPPRCWPNWMTHWSSANWGWMVPCAP